MNDAFKGQAWQQMAGGDEQPQQQMAFNCPACAECSRMKEYYSQLREYSHLPSMQRADVTFNTLGILFGYTNVILIAVLLGAIFAREVIKITVWLIKFWSSKKINISVGGEDG